VQPDPRARFDLAADLRAALASLERLDEQPDPEPPSIIPATHRATAAPTVVLSADRGSESYSVEVPSFSRGDEPPRWNRPSLGPPPFRPLPEPGMGARARASLPLFALREPPLVGRDKELQQIWDLARQVNATGRPRAVILRGEAGVGKTRLVSSVSRSLEESGHAMPVEVSFSLHRGPGDGYAAAVRRLLRLAGQDAEMARARLERWLARDCQDVSEQVMLEAALLQRWGVPSRTHKPVSSAVAREYLFKHLERYAWRGLGLLVVENVHHCAASDDGADLAAAVLQLGVPALAIVTCRVSALDFHPRSRASVQALRELGATEITLERIPAAEMAALVDEYLPLEPTLAAEVVRRSEGNPLFARELIGQWCRDNALVPATPPSSRRSPPPELRFRLAVPRSDAIPEDIRSLLASRLSTLILRSRNAAQVGDALDVVGVAGSGVPWSILEEAAGPGFGTLVEGGLLRRRRGTAFLDHALLAQLLEERVQGKAVVKAHTALAQAWRRASDDPRASLQVGHHELAAGRVQEAIGPLVRAVQWLEVAGSATGLRATALDLNRAAQAAGEDQAPWYLAQLALASADRAAGAIPEAVKRIEALLDRVPDDADLAIEVAAQYVNTLDYEPKARKGLPVLEAVEKRVPEASLTAQARFYQARAACLLHLGRNGPAERELARALSTVVHEPHRAELVYQMGKCLKLSDSERALGALDEACQLARHVGYRSLEAQALAWKAMIHGMLGSWKLGSKMAEEAERLALAIGFHWQVPLCRNSRAECLRFQGKLPEAIELYLEGRGWAAATGQKSWSYVADLNLALCALIECRMDMLRERLDAIAREDAPRWEPFAPMVAGLEAAWRVFKGEGPEALQGVPYQRAVAEGLDGALLLAILLRAVRARGWGAEAGRIWEALQRGMQEAGLQQAHLGPMLARHDEALKRTGLGGVVQPG